MLELEPAGNPLHIPSTYRADSLTSARINPPRFVRSDCRQKPMLVHAKGAGRNGRTLRQGHRSEQYGGERQEKLTYTRRHHRIPVPGCQNTPHRDLAAATSQFNTRRKAPEPNLIGSRGG